MSTIKVVCIDQTLAFNNTPVITSGGLNEDFVSFTFCALWSGFTRTAVFWRSEKEVYHQTLDADDRCQIPPEVTGEDGVIYFGVFGVNAKGVQRTSEVLNYRIHKGAITTGTKPSDPTPDIYTQILARCQDVKDEVAVERARINNLIKLEEGSTTGDAELADIRVGADGTVHPSAGEAVRYQYLDAIASTAYLEGDVIVAKEELHDIRKGYDGKVYDFAGEAVRKQFENIMSIETSDLSAYPIAGNYYVRNGVKTDSGSWVSYEIEPHGAKVVKFARLACSKIDISSIYAISFYNSTDINAATLMAEDSVFFNGGTLADGTTAEYLFYNIPIPENCKIIVVSNRQATLATPTATFEKKYIKVSQESFAGYVTQETGTDKYKVMSQKAVTDELKALSGNTMPKVTSADGHYKLFAYKKGEKMIYYWERVDSDAEFYDYEATPPGILSVNDAFYYERLYDIGDQDGAFYKDLFYHDTGHGTVNIVNPLTGARVASYQHDKQDLLKPHGNSVAVIDVDGTPYMYSNIYNNYSAEADKHIGECCVYKMVAHSSGEDITFEQGSLKVHNGTTQDSTDRYRTGFIDISALESVTFGSCNFIVSCYDSANLYLGQLSVDLTALNKSSGQWISAGTVVTMASLASVDSTISHIRLVAETTQVPNATFVFPKPSDTLEQLIKIGFTNNADLWTVTDSRPYGNFIPDPTHGFLYAFVLDKATNATKWHKFQLPSVTDGVYNATYGCNVVTLETTDILESWTTSYATFIQGCCYYDNKLWITNGGGYGVAYLRVIDLNTKTEIAVINLGEAGITDEPESVNFYKGVCHYSTLTGMYKLVLV